jgi:hypothetical protein
MNRVRSVLGTFLGENKFLMRDSREARKQSGMPTHLSIVRMALTFMRLQVALLERPGAKLRLCEEMSLAKPLAAI